MRTTLFLIISLSLALPLARAETIDSGAVTLGWQAEHAQVIVRADLVSQQDLERGILSARFSVTDALKGDVAAGDEVTVIYPDGGHGAPWSAGVEHLLFLVRDRQHYKSVAGLLGIRVIPAKGPEREFPLIVRQHLETLAPDGKVARPDRLRTLLVRLLSHEDPGVVWSAATDLVRHDSLHAGLATDQRRLVLEAYRTHPVGKISKHALATAVGALKPDGAAQVLVSSLARPGGRPIRGVVSEALSRIGDPQTTQLLIDGAEGATGEARQSMIFALGVVGHPSGAPAVRGFLRDTDPGVRTQAAHALGRIARHVRDLRRSARREGREEDAAPAPVEGREELTAFLAVARTGNELRAGTWALAQLDEQRAFDELRRLMKEDPRPDVRRLAERYLERPRLSLILK